MRSTWNGKTASFLAVGTVALLGLVRCSGAGATGSAHHDAGADGASGYSGSSSGSLGPQGGSSGGGGDDAADVDALEGDASMPPSDATPPEGSTDAGTVAKDAASSGASSCQTPEGGLACDPGVVACGSTACSTASSFCCVGGGQGGTGEVCSPFNGASCPSSALTVACDETADCTGAVCCEQNAGLGAAGPTQCLASCPSGWFQVCKSNTECGAKHDGGSPGRCVRQTCTQPSGLFGGGSSVTLEACAVPASLGNLNNDGALMGCVAQ